MEEGGVGLGAGVIAWGGGVTTGGLAVGTVEEVRTGRVFVVVDGVGADGV